MGTAQGAKAETVEMRYCAAEISLAVSGRGPK